ncbi:MAG: DotA/TraY family protein [Rhodospirillaceae bacterium]|nr:DotA/TraY family protein [Rhodospirillaceae bacterium]
MLRPPSAALIAALAAAALAPGEASAQAATDILEAFSSPGDPLTNRFLSRIFGCRLFPAEGDCAGQATPVFAAAIGLFNAFCLALGMALFAWNGAAGVMQTAHEGEVLGRRWNSAWAPVRTLASAAMLTPLPGMEGYNSIQTVIAWLVRGSTAGASIVWASAASLVATHQAPVTQPSALFDPAAVGAAWRMASCQSVLNQLFDETKTGGGLSPFLAPASGRPQSPNPRERASSGPARPPTLGTSSAGSALPFGVCGKMTMPEPPEIAYDRGLEAEWFRAHGEALLRLATAMREVSDGMIAHELRDPGASPPEQARGGAAAIVAAGNAYARDLSVSLPRIAESAGAVAGGSLSAEARARIEAVVAGGYASSCDPPPEPGSWLAEICSSSSPGQGWLGAGAWYMHLARFANEAAALFHARPESAEASLVGAVADADSAGRTFWQAIKAGLFGTGGEGARLRKRARDLLAGIENRWNAAVILAAADGAPVDSRLIAGAFASEGVSSGRPAPGVRDWLASKTRQWFLPPPTADPMAALAEFGNAQLAWGLGLAAGGKAVEFGAASAGALGRLIPAAQIAGELGRAAAVIGGALMLSGSFLAFILPMLPFLLWTAAVTGYFLLVAEAVIAANLWAVAHLRLDGEGLSGEAARQGYYLVLALTLTPVLMVFGFLLGMAIFKVTATLVGIGLDVALRGLAHDQSWAVWLLGMAIVSILMVIVYAVLAERSFSLVAELPGKVLRWVGADASVASREDDRIRATAIGGAAAVGSVGSRLAPDPSRLASRGGGRRARAAEASGQRPAER